MRMNGKFFLVFFILLIFSSCIDEVNIKTKEEDHLLSSLTIRIPSIKGAAQFGATRNDEFKNTRALDEALEGRINSLWLCAYPISNGAGEIKIQKIDLTLEDSGKSDYQFDEYTVPIKKGIYHLYLLANIEDYLSLQSINPDISEEELKKLILNFSTDKFLEKGNLPMACLASDIKLSPNQSPAGNKGINISDNTTIYADLTFLCSKVRYTILFDRDNFSNAFSNNNIDFESSVKASNVSFQTALFKDCIINNHSLGIYDKLVLNAVKYPDSNSAYLDIKNSGKESLADLEIQKHNDNTSQRAWQGIFYLPENFTTEEAKKTTLTFSSSTGSAELNDNYDVDLPPDNKGLERGNFYDIVSKLTKPNSTEQDISLSIQEWNITNLSYSLHGPYELVVEKTSLEEVGTEKWSAPFWYRSDIAPEYIKFQSPTIELEGKETDIFSVEIIRDETTFDFLKNANGDYLIHTRINPNIPYKKLQNITESDKYFYLIAGNLYKKIEISELNIKPFLNVTPDEIEINMLDLRYDRTIETSIFFESNLEESISFMIEEDKGNLDINKFNISVQEGISSVSGNKYTLSSKRGIINLSIVDLSDDYWKEKHSFILTFSTEKKQIEDVKVHISFNPEIIDYVIHFRCSNPDIKWTNPHIIINPVNTDSSGEANFISSSETKHNYNWEKWLCFSCQNEVTEPKESEGVIVRAMEPEYDGNYFNGWWKFTLTGSFDPGKTLLKFIDTHPEEETDNSFRFPEKNLGGIYLLDFKDHEGWLNYNGVSDDFINNYFVAEKPSGNEPIPNLSSQKYRIFWPKEDWDEINISNWETSNETIVNEDNYNYTYLEFTSKDPSQIFGYEMIKEINGPCGRIHNIFKDFKEEDDILCAYFSSHDHTNNLSFNLFPGTPEDLKNDGGNEWVSDKASELYIITEFNKWEKLDDFQFYTKNEKFTWETKIEVKILSTDRFVLVDTQNNDVMYGWNQKTHLIYKGSEYELFEAIDKNKEYVEYSDASTYYGKLTLKKIDDRYIIIF